MESPTALGEDVVVKKLVSAMMVLVKHTKAKHGLVKKWPGTASPSGE